MRMSKEYWYGGYTEMNLNRHPNRKEVLRPTGLFVLNGKSLCRDASSGKQEPTYDVSHAASLYRSPERGEEPLRASRTVQGHSPQRVSSPFLIRSPGEHAFPSKYYNRWKTPTPEVVDDYQRAIRQAKATAYNHIFVDDSFRFPKRLESSFAAADSPRASPVAKQRQLLNTKVERIMLPSKQRIDSLERSWKPLKDRSPIK